ncbi:MAG TPA: hypothetical protein VEG44_08845 [Candidatus Acidoferrales bacterium]|nr:hypothetical protein [Candidatus Acidoferrales bacterium]
MLFIPFIGPLMALPFFIVATIALIGLPTPANLEAAAILCFVGLL